MHVGFAIGPDAIAHKLDVLDRHCAQVGRDPADIERTLSSRVAESSRCLLGFDLERLRCGDAGQPIAAGPRRQAR